MSYLVVHVSRYDFQDARGQAVRGCSVTYLDQPFADSNQKGLAPLKVSADSSLWGSFSSVPARYDLHFRQKPDSKGRPTLVLVSAQLAQDEQLEPDSDSDDLERELADLCL